MGTKDPASELLDRQWEVWLASNLIRSRPVAELVDALIAHGLTRERAEAEVARVAGSPGVVAANETLKPVVLAAQLRREHLRLASDRIPVRAGLDGRQLLDEHIATQCPVIVPDLLAGWPALRWTWAELAERFGAIEVSVCEGRDAVDQPTRRWRDLQVRRPFAEVIARILDRSTGNDLYVVANNQALEGALAGLLADVRPVEGVLPAHRLSIASAWIGPGGTFTAAHHDVSDLLFCQILGRKQVILAPPEELELAEQGSGFFGPESGLERFAGAVRRAEVGPGETLLIPAGWWHEVRSLEPSLTLTFAGLVHPNDFRWYRPAPPEGVSDP